MPTPDMLPKGNQPKVNLAKEIAIKHFGPSYTTPELMALDDAIKTERARWEIPFGAINEDRYRIRAVLEQLIADIRPNLGTHDHTDWELRQMVERAEAAINAE